MSTFGEKLKERRITKGYTQRELADKVGVRTATISRYENETRDSQWEILSNLAYTLDTSADYLLGLTDNPHSLDTIIQSNNLTYDQLKLLSTYMELPQKEKELVLERALSYHDQQKD